MLSRLLLFDQDAVRFLSRGCAYPAVRMGALVATRLADGWGLGIVIPLALVVGGARGFAAIGIGVISAVTLAILVQSLKAVVKRARPSGLDVERAITAPDLHAFPSGHTAQAFGMVVLTWWVAPWMGVLAIPGALAVAASRMIFGLHYPSDVAVGALLGAGITGATLAIATQCGLVDWLMRISPVA